MNWYGWGSDGVKGELLTEAVEVGWEFVRVEDFVDVVACFELVGRWRQTGPDHGGGVDGGDEEDKVGGATVVYESGVGKGNAGEVEEVAALSDVSLSVYVGKR